MAAELLTAFKQGQWLKHEAHHDLESFIWVLTYVISRHLNERSGITKEQREGLKTHFTESFGLYSVQAIRVARLSLQPFEMPIYEGLMPIPIQTLLGNLREAVRAHFVPPPMPGVITVVKPLTHDLVLNYFDAAYHTL